MLRGNSLRGCVSDLALSGLRNLDYSPYGFAFPVPWAVRGIDSDLGNGLKILEDGEVKSAQGKRTIDNSPYE